MTRLIQILLAYRVVIVFVFLEFLCIWMMVENNSYTGVKYLNSASLIVGNIYSSKQELFDYIRLGEVNDALAVENAKLKTALEQYKLLKLSFDSLEYEDHAHNMSYIDAKVINNSVLGYKNFITINKGYLDGIRSGMAVVGADGAVGKVKEVSDHFSVIMSVLNIDHRISARIKRSGEIGVVRWEGTDPLIVKLEFIPRHALPVVGDSVLTSGFNAVFPSNIPIGIVHNVTLRDESSFYDIDVQLVQNFNSLAYVEIVAMEYKSEVDSIQMHTVQSAK